MSAADPMHERATRESGRPVALVTGAARNIGRAIAERLQRDGYQLVITTHETPAHEVAGAPASTTREEAAELGARLDWDVLACDLAAPESAAALAAFIEERYGRLDCIVNNAATWTYGPALEISDREWREVLEVNVIALVRLLRVTIALLRAAPSPRVINMSSIGASWSGNGVGPYNVSKAGVSALTRTLAVELAEDGILVNAVAPGFIDTTSNAHELDDPDMLARRLAQVPAGRAGLPQEVADAVAYLASPSLGFVTGSVLTIDGGQLAGARKGREP